MPPSTPLTPSTQSGFRADQSPVNEALIEDDQQEHNDWLENEYHPAKIDHAEVRRHIAAMPPLGWSSKKPNGV
jgi:hypothetical protein